MRHYRFHGAVRCAVPTAATPLTSVEADGNVHTAATVEATENNNCAVDEPLGIQQHILR